MTDTSTNQEGRADEAQVGRGGGILSSSLLILFLVIIVRPLVLVRESVVAAQFGVSRDLDLFFLSFGIISLINSALFNSIRTALIPVMSVYIERAQKQSKDSPLRSLTMLYLLVCVPTCIGLYFCVPGLVAYVAVGYSPEDQQSIAAFIRGLIWWLVFFGYASVLHAVLHVTQRFVLSFSLPGIAPALAIALLMLCNNCSVYLLVTALQISAFVELVILVIALQRGGWSLLPGMRYLGDETRKIVYGAFALAWGSVFVTGMFVVDRVMVDVVGNGAISLLTYGYRVPNLLITLALTAFGTALLPYLSRAVADAATGDLLSILRRYTWGLMAASGVLAALLFLFSRPIVNLLFNYGNFSESAVEMVSVVQRAYFLGLPAYIGGIASIRCMVALGKNVQLSAISAMAFFLNIILNHFFIQIWGVVGVAFSTVLVFSWSTLMAMGYLAFYYRDHYKNKIQPQS